ncbi:mechanosensitive ion channel family protein [bacterium]|nr:mechanosensitive ion channel family protein [bacterium]
MKKSLKLCVFGLVLSISVICPAHISCSVWAAEDQPVDPAITAPVFDYLSLQAWFGELRDLHDQFEQSLLAGEGSDSLGETLDELDLELDELDQPLGVPTDEDYLRTVLDVRDQARMIRDKLQQVKDVIGPELDGLKNAQKVWQQQTDKLAQYKETPFSEETAASWTTLMTESEKIIRQTQQTIREKIAIMSEHLARAISQQNHLEGKTRHIDQLVKQARTGLFRQTVPTFFSGVFWGEIRSSLDWALFQPLLQNELLKKTVFSQYGWLFVLQLMAILVVTRFFKRQRIAKPEDGFFDKISLRPWSTALLVVIAVSIPMLKTGPASYRLFYLICACLASIRVMNVQLTKGWQQKLTVFMLTPYIALLIFRFIQLPQPFFRLYIAFIALWGAPLSFQLARRISRTGGETNMAVRGLQLGGYMLVLVFLAQVFGFNALATHLYESSVQTVLLVMFVYLLWNVTRKVLPAILDLSFFGRWAFIMANRTVIVKRLLTFLMIVFIVVALFLALYIWGVYNSPQHAWHEISQIGFRIGAHDITVELIILGLLALLVTWYSSLALQSILNEEVYPRKEIEPGIGVSINRLVHYALVLIGFFWFVTILGFDLKNVTIIGGALGIGVGFGLQNIVSNFVSGLVLLVERPIRLGDVVEINNTWGEILKLGLRSTVVGTYDGSEIIIPNSDLITQQVTNWTRLDRISRLKIQVGVSYDSDVKKVMSLLLEIGQAHPLCLKEPSPKVHFTAFGESSLDFELWLWLDELSNRLKVKTELMLQIFERFQQEKISIPFPQRDVHLVDQSPASPLDK